MHPITTGPEQKHGARAGSSKEVSSDRYNPSSPHHHTGSRCSPISMSSVTAMAHASNTERWGTHSTLVLTKEYSPFQEKGLLAAQQKPPGIKPTVRTKEPPRLYERGDYSMPVLLESGTRNTLAHAAEPSAALSPSQAFRVGPVPSPGRSTGTSQVSKSISGGDCCCCRAW